MRLEYEIGAMDNGQLRRVLRGAEQEIIASSRRMDLATRRRGGPATPASAAKATAETKRATTTAARELARQHKEDLRIRNAVNQLEVRDWQKKEREKTTIANRESRRRNTLAQQEVRTAERTRRSFGRGVVQSAASNTRKVVGMGATILGGVGGFMAAGALDSAIANKGMAIDIANNASINTRGRNGAQIESEAGAMALAGKTSSESVLGAIGKFQAPTGNLDAAMQNMPELIKLATATGTALDDMAEAAGRVMAADASMTPDKLLDTMRTIAGQGKEGAVEIRELATAMAKLTGASGAIGGDKGAAVAQLGAVAQMAISKGGAGSGEDAGTAAARFVDHAKKMKSMGGVNFQDETGMLRGPRDIIEDLIDKSHGSRKFDIDKFGIEGNRAIDGYLATYNSTEGPHEKKMAAVRSEFDRMLGPKAVLSKATVNAAASARNAAPDKELAKVKEEFNQAVGKEMLPVLTKLIPELSRLVPSVAKAAGIFGELAAVAVEHPFAAALAAIGAGVAKDIVAAQIGAKIGDAIGKSATLGAGLTITSAAITATTVGSLIIEKLANDADKANKDVHEDLIKTQNIEGALVTGKPGAYDEATNQLGVLQGRIVAGEGAKAFEGPGGKIAATVGAGLNYVTAGGAGKSYGAQQQASADAANLPALKQEMADLMQAMLTAVAKFGGHVDKMGNIKLNVDNPKADPNRNGVPLVKRP